MTQTEINLYNRHSELVDIKFNKGLTPFQELELDYIKSELNRIEKPFYEEAICKLTIEVERLKTIQNEK
jgi:hypothetical protein